jgi:hypothetical protein
VRGKKSLQLIERALRLFDHGHPQQPHCRQHPILPKATSAAPEPSPSADHRVRGAERPAALLALLGNADMRSILPNSEAIALMFDRRTLAMLANPAELPLQNFRVLLHREHVATSVNGDKMFMNKSMKTHDPVTGALIPGRDTTDVNLVADRKTKAYLEGSEQVRSGRTGLPFHVDTDTIYPSYVITERKPLPLKYDHG